MRFRQEWLASVVRVPYAPTLGAVHPDAIGARLFDAIVSVAGTGRFLPYDKDARWLAAKDEQVITGEIIHADGLTVIPALSTRGQGALKVYHYGHGRPDMGQVAEWAAKWRATYGTGSARVIWTQDHPDEASTRLMLKTYTTRDQQDPGASHVSDLGACLVASTFPAFAAEMAADGFAFLYKRVQAGTVTGPVLVAVDKDRIVGAVGPLSVMTDAAGQPTMPPQYFAVHPGYRRKGYGRALWRASMSWGYASNAAYKVLNAQAGAPAERFYESEGLTTLGYVCTQEIPTRESPLLHDNVSVPDRVSYR
jgi:GNAT superfamily N-acetyltransferase